MALWIDMTNSLRVWQGGVVGIIRAELELAKNLKKHYPNLRISVDDGGNGFLEIKSEELQWLWDSDSVADAYLKHTGRKKREDSNAEIKEMRTESPKLAGLEHAYAYSTSRMMRLKRAGYLIKENSPKLLRPVEYLAGGILYLPIKGGSKIRASHKRRKERRQTINQSKNFSLTSRELFYPYKENDIVLSVGWYTSNKEELFSKIKAKLKNLYLVYLVYDIILIKKGTTQFYPESTEFRRYFEWVTNNCDFVLYGGRTAQEDSEAYQKEKGLRVPPGDFIKFGSDVKTGKSSGTIEEVLKKYKIHAPYLLTVGSVEPRKNHDVLYKAYSILADRNELENIPQIIIVGGEYRCENFRDAIQVDPKIKNKIKIIHPDDNELDLLYQACMFVVLPTLYEGWSLTLPEAFGYSKLCLASDVRPLREVGRELAVYVDPLNPSAWAEAIKKYSSNKELRQQRESMVRNQWEKITWEDCSQEVLSKLKNMKLKKQTGTLYYDLTLVWSLSFQGANVSGILRTELILARYLSRIFPQMHFFALSVVKGYIEIDRNMISEILGTQNIETAFEQSRYPLMAAEGNQKPVIMAADNSQMKEAFWLICSVMPNRIQKKVIEQRLQKLQKKEGIEPGTQKSSSWLNVPFQKTDLIFSAGTGFDMALYSEILRLKKQIGFRFVQLIYDFTPTLLPQVHRKETISYYVPFLKYSSRISDVIFYGGETAMRDGIEYQKENGLPVRPGKAIRFGSNIVSPKKLSKEEELEELKKLGIRGPFIIAVGSIEIRKNHETLYQAYLRWLEQEEEVPQLIFAGYPGWKTEELLRTICLDERIWDKLLIRTPTDEQLDILYRNCLFTVLASQYEGWSLTLPESLNYGKFCIASQVDPLMEIGKDFIDYVHPWDVAGWENKMSYYYKHPQELKKKEKRIASEWNAISWEDCAKQVAGELKVVMEEKECREKKS